MGTWSPVVKLGTKRLRRHACRQLETARRPLRVLRLEERFGVTLDDPSDGLDILLGGSSKSRVRSG